jgi:cytoskeletal protein RodZ
MHSQTLPQEYPKEIGALLKAARQARSLDHSEIASKLALSASQLRLLETGETAGFYNQHFYLQAARRYGAFLNIELPALPPQPTLEAAPLSPAKEPDHVEKQQDPAPARQLAGRKAVLVSMTAFGLAVLGTLFALQFDETRSPPPQSAKAEAPPAAATQAASSEPAPPPAPTQTAQQTSTQTPPQTSPQTPTITNAQASFLNTDSSWIQIVSKDGNKTNLKPQAGELVQFDPQSTAAVTFGKPSTAKLTVNGQEVAIEKFLVNEASPPRALVILRDL